MPKLYAVAMRRSLFTLIILFVIIPAVSQATKNDAADDSKFMEINELKSEVKRMKETTERIHNAFEIYDLDMVNENYSDVRNKLNGIDNTLENITDEEEAELGDHFYESYNEAIKSYSKLITLYDLYMALEDRKESWSDQYFRLWETVFVLKTRVDNLYVREENMNMHYGGMKDYKYESIRKRNIYEVCNSIYNEGIMDLKGTGDCAHYERIQILNEVLPVLKKCDKLAIIENTRDLEKQLKKADDLEVQRKTLLDYPLTD